MADVDGREGADIIYDVGDLVSDAPWPNETTTRLRGAGYLRSYATTPRLPPTTSTAVARESRDGGAVSRELRIDYGKVRTREELKYQK